jgi:hypothetical protein
MLTPANDIKTISEPTQEALDKRIKEYLEQGYMLYGNVVIAQNRFIQQVIKIEKETL